MHWRILSLSTLAVLYSCLLLCWRQHTKKTHYLCVSTQELSIITTRVIIVCLTSQPNCALKAMAAKLKSKKQACANRYKFTHHLSVYPVVLILVLDFTLQLYERRKKLKTDEERSKWLQVDATLMTEESVDEDGETVKQHKLPWRFEGLRIKLYSRNYPFVPHVQRQEFSTIAV